MSFNGRTVVSKTTNEGSIPSTRAYLIIHNSSKLKVSVFDKIRIVYYTQLMKIKRLLEQKLPSLIQPGKVLVVYGPRRVGKTTLVKDFLKEYQGPYRFMNGEELSSQELLSQQNSAQLGQLISAVSLLVIDEAQRVPNIGLNLKILIDSFPHISIVATGSASLDIASKVEESLTGRKKTILLYPISFNELIQTYGAVDVKKQLNRWLIWGSYPETISIKSEEERSRYLDELAGSYLYKDILELDGVRHANKIVGLLRLLAFQIGNEVSLTELAGNLALNRKTVERYLDLLEKSFVIFRLGGFSRNLRKEIIKNSRYYFYDNGVRNSLIQNFSQLSLRNDVGQLWENYLMIERLKYLDYSEQRVNRYFWRTYDKKEIDLIEESGGVLHGYEFKLQGEVKRSTQIEFENAYNGRVRSINQKNFENFLT